MVELIFSHIPVGLTKKGNEYILREVVGEVGGRELCTSMAMS
jgi:hypothetical protein